MNAEEESKNMTRRRNAIISGCLVLLILCRLAWFIQKYTIYKATEQARYALGQQREAEIDHMIEVMKLLYPPRTPAQEIIKYFQSNNIPHQRHIMGGGYNYQCPCIIGAFKDVYEGLFYRTDLYIVVMTDENDRVVDIRKSSSTLSL